MSGRKRIFVSHNESEGRWEVKEAGHATPISSHLKKETAVDRGRAEAKHAPLGQLVVKKMDGTIQTEYTYGADPFPPPG